MKSLIAGVIGVWFGLIVVLGATGEFIGSAGSPPLPLLVGAMVPLLVFVAAYLVWGRFRKAVLTADLRLLIALQAWRAGGLGFLALSANGVLPRLFAWPAGLGDIAVGVTAPFVALALVRSQSFAGSRRFVLWNILGILDLVVALSMGALNSGFIPGVVGSVTTAPMARLPLVLIPAFLVPLFLMLHLVALFQARRIPHEHSPRSYGWTAPSQGTAAS